MENRRLNLTLTDEQARFIHWMAKRDNCAFQAELRMIFYCELEHCMELYEEEMQHESEGNA